MLLLLQETRWGGVGEERRQSESSAVKRSVMSEKLPLDFSKLIAVDLSVDDVTD